MSSLPDEMLALKKFHGHLGPYAVLGYRMGLIARSTFPERIYAIVHSGTKRPLSCLADGVQMSSCCTLGKSNITVMEDGEARVEFSDGPCPSGVRHPARGPGRGGRASAPMPTRRRWPCVSTTLSEETALPDHRRAVSPVRQMNDTTTNTRKATGVLIA